MALRTPTMDGGVHKNTSLDPKKNDLDMKGIDKIMGILRRTIGQRHPFHEDFRHSLGINTLLYSTLTLRGGLVERAQRNYSAGADERAAVNGKQKENE